MIHVNNLKKQYGDDILFDEVSIHIRKRDRIALVGDNGTGKSTFLKILAGKESIDNGQIAYTGSATTGYLPQFLYSDEEYDRNLFEELSAVFSTINKKSRKLTELENKMGKLEYDSDEFEKVMEKYGNLQEELQKMGYYEIGAKIKSILFGLGFSEEDLEKKCSEFSGGWQMRIALAKILVEYPDVLLLDEPTNHLDIEARNWLEDFIKSYPGAVILVSHDRFFLDSTVKRVIEIYASQMWVYSGNYSKFEILREEFIEQVHKEAREYEEKVSKTQKFIDKFRYQANKASQVQSRVKMLNKMSKPVIPPKKKRIFFRFPKAPNSGHKVLKVDGVSKEFDDNLLFFDASFEVEKGERIALVGKNGKGKTTLMKIIAGILEADTGEVEFGYKVVYNYYAQEPSELLDSKKTVYDELYQDADSTQAAHLRNVLGAFLFSDDDVYKRVKVLSGGERSRLALAKMLLKKANLLILDEPTNHLDLTSKDILMDALKYFEGTIIFVSHDRYFVDNIANRIIYLQDKEIKSFNGGYEDYLAKIPTV
ncbi:MAG: ABC-F family ATP-binding cassette domain-containing protein [Candidatus Muiribacteriota bacterium]